MTLAITRLEPFNINNSATFTFASTSITANVSAGNVKTDNLLYANGTPWAFSNYSDANVASYLPTYTGNVSANYFIGNGSSLSHITGGNVDGQVGYAAVANSVAGANVSGEVSFAATANSVDGSNVSGAVGLATYATTANSVAGSNVSGAVGLATYASTANSVAGSNVSGAVGLATYATTANSVSGSNVSGEVNYAAVANSVAVANVSGIGNIATINLDGNVSNILHGDGSFAGIGTIANANYSNYSGNAFSVAGANVTGQVSYAATANSVNGSNVVGEVSYAATANSVAGANVSGTVSSATTAGTVTTSAQSNITSVGTLTGLAVNGNVDVKTLNANTTINVTATTDSTGTGTGALTVAGGASVTKDLWVGGTLHVPNLAVTNTTTLDVTAPLLYLNANTPYPYSYDLGVYSHFQTTTGDPTEANGYQHTGFVRNHADNAWYLFSNVFAEPTGGTVDLSNANLKFDNIKVGNVVALNANLGNLTQSNYFSGSGNLLSNIQGSNITGAVGLATYATTANAVAGSNVSGAVGLATYATTANAVAGSNVSGAVGLATYATTANSVAGANVSGEVSYAATANSVAAANVTGAVSYASTANSVAGANVSGQVSNALVAGTVYTAAQPNITSVGTLTSFTSDGTVNFTNASNVSLGAVGNIHITGGTAGYVLQTDGSGVLTWADPTPTTTTYVPNSLSLTNGVYVSGGLSDIQTFGDYGSGNVYVLTDGTGSAPAWIFTVDFTSVVAFNRVVMNINYTQSSGHTIYVQLYNTTTSTWDSIGTYTGLGSYYAFALEVIDETDYVNGSGIVQLRLYHSNSGNSGHTTSIDYIALEQSTQGPQGPRGPTGATGAAGNGIATGGTAGQILIKNSSTNYDTAWSSDLTLTSGNVSAGNLKTDNLLYANGTAWSFGSPSSITNGNSNVNIPSANGNVTISASGNANIIVVTGTGVNVAGTLNTGSSVISGNGSGLTALTGANITGSVPSATTASTVTTAAQPNITSVGSLTGLTVSNATGVVNFTTTANVTLGAVANLHISGGSTDYVLKTDGAGNLSWTSPTSGITNGNSNISIPSANGNINFSASGNANILTVTGSSVNVNAVMTVTGVITSGSGSGGSITGANLVSANYFSGDGGLLSNITAATAGTVTTAAQPNITSLGTLTSVTVSGTATAGNVSTGGNISASGTLSVTGNANVGNIGATGGVFTTVAGSLTTASQPNVTSVGTLSSLTVSGLLTASGTGIKVANIQDTTGTITIRTNYGSEAGSVGITGNLTIGTAGAGGITVVGVSNLGDVANVRITGGTANYHLKTDGAGNLSWVAPVSLSDDTSTSATYYPVYATSSSGEFVTAGISTTKLQFNPSSGQLTVQDLNTLSDATLKANPEVIEDPMAILSQIFGMGFNWLDSGKKSYGLMAQMLEKVLPELVSTNAQGKKTVNYIPIIAFLIEAVKKQQSDIEDLKKR